MEKTPDILLEEQVKLIQGYVDSIPGFAELFEILMYPDEEFDEVKKFILIQYQNELLDSSKKQKLRLLYKVIQESNPDIKENLDLVAKEVRKTLEGQVCESKIDFVEQIVGMTKTLLEESFTDREEVPVPTELCRDDAKYPIYAHLGDDGMDLFAAEDVLIAPMKIPDSTEELPLFYTLSDKVAKNVCIVPTGVKMAIPDGYMAEIKPRSGHSLFTYLRVANSPGTIDTGYFNEIGVICENVGFVPLLIKKGDKIAQMSLRHSPMIRIAPVKSVEEFGRNRGGGYGHTGVR